MYTQRLSSLKISICFKPVFVLSTASASESLTAPWHGLCVVNPLAYSRQVNDIYVSRNDTRIGSHPRHAHTHVCTEKMWKTLTNTQTHTNTHTGTYTYIHDHIYARKYNCKHAHVLHTKRMHTYKRSRHYLLSWEGELRTQSM